MSAASTQSLTWLERATYEWQMSICDFGEAGQETLKRSSVLISRCGGVGGAVAYQLAAAGVGRLILAHGGNVKFSDLNRQILMTHDWLGKPRVSSAQRRLRELNPNVVVEAVDENVTPSNVAWLVSQVDLVVDCAPLFEERFLMNAEAIAQRKPLLECAMYELQAQMTTVVPGLTPCLSCLYPKAPAAWKRKFPVFGAVAGMIGCLGAMEAIKVLTGMGEPLRRTMLVCDLRNMTFRKIKIAERPGCPVCGDLWRGRER